MPIGAVLVSQEISDVIHTQSNELGTITTFHIIFAEYPTCFLNGFSFIIVLGSFSHGFTYSGHPVACAVALETLKIYQYVVTVCIS